MRAPSHLTPSTPVPAHRVARSRLSQLALAAALALSTLIIAAPAHALGEATNFGFAQLKHDGTYDPNPTAISRLAWEVVKRTSIEASLDPVIADPADTRLFERPFAVLTSGGAFSPPTDAAVAALRRYLLTGGFLLIDVANDEGAASAQSLVERLFGPGKLARVPGEHVIYHSFYMLDGPAGRLSKAPFVEGVFVDERLAVVLSRNDMLGAFARDGYGNWTRSVEGGNKQRERAFRFGVNLVMYALCLDYKDDQVHLPFILKRRR